jgi:hypothetical protein
LSELRQGVSNSRESVDWYWVRDVLCAVRQ